MFNIVDELPKAIAPPILAELFSNLLFFNVMFIDGSKQIAPPNSSAILLLNIQSEIIAILPPLVILPVGKVIAEPLTASLLSNTQFEIT